jgi:hypothetical protein
MRDLDSLENIVNMWDNDWIINEQQQPEETS